MFSTGEGQKKRGEKQGGFLRFGKQTKGTSSAADLIFPWREGILLSGG